MKHAARAVSGAAALALLALAPPLGAQQGDESDPLEVEGLVVTATPVPLPPGSLGGHVTVLYGEELRARGILTVTEALRQRAGMSLVRSGSYGSVTSLFLRGGESDHVQVMIDGVPINRPGGAVDLAGLTTEAVERIEIVRGPASALNGSDAVAGVVNVITRRGSETGAPVGTVTVRAGVFGRPDGAADGGAGDPPAGDRLDAILEARGGDPRASYGFSLARYSTDGVFELNNRHRNSVLTGTAGFALSDASYARITTRLSDRSYRFPTDAAGNPVDANQETFSQETTVGVLVGHRFGPPGGGPGSVDVTALVSLHDLETGTDDAPDGPADTVGFYAFQSLDAVRRTGADLRAIWSPTGRLSVAGGAELELQRVRSFNESSSSFGTTTGRSEHTRSNRALYLHTVAELGGLTARVGARAEDNERFGGFLTWQAGAAWEARPGTRLRASAGRGIKEPTFFETFATGFVRGNPELDPERSRSWEVGLEQALGDAARAEVTWFDQSFRDLIQFTATPPGPEAPSFYNVAEARARGLEVVLRGRIRGVEWSAEGTWLDTEVVDAGFDTGEGATFVDGARLIRRPEHQLRLAAAGSAGARVRWHASVGRVGERSDRDFSSFPAEPVTLDAYTTVDAGVRARLVDGSIRDLRVDLILEGENLTDERYREVFGFPSPGRALTAGVRVGVGR